MIKITQLHKSFGAQKVLCGISLEVETGKILAVIGPSGTGKSVLLKIITGLLPADSGEVLVGKDSMTGAKSVKERQRICSRMGVLFQTAALFDSLTLLENVAFPLRYNTKLSRREILTKAFELLDDVGLGSHARALPGEVSIGMRKRVGIARALVTEPELLLFDEPNTGLDPETGQEIYELIKEVHDSRGFTGVVISHEIPEVFQVCDRVLMLYDGQVQEEGSIDQVCGSTNPAVAQFMAGSLEGPIQMSGR